MAASTENSSNTAGYNMKFKSVVISVLNPHPFVPLPDTNAIHFNTVWYELKYKNNSFSEDN